MSPALEERKLQYIKTIESGFVSEEKTWWQYPAPSYRYTRDYAANIDKTALSGEAVIFKNEKKTWLIVIVMLVTASLLLYLIGKKEFSLAQLLFLMLLLLIVLPPLLNNKEKIRVSGESIWLYKKNKDIAWDDVMLTYIKEVHEETSSYFFIVHYYDEDTDEFKGIEIELDGLVSPAALSATIEAFRPS